MFIAALIYLAAPLPLGLQLSETKSVFGNTPALTDNRFSTMCGSYVPPTFTEESTRLYARDQSSDLVERIDMRTQMDVWWNEQGTDLIAVNLR